MTLRLIVAVAVACVVCIPGNATARDRDAVRPLANASSAFLRAHADSPVRWMPWGREAVERARAEQKPVFLAIGAFTSELSRAMREQSFDRPETAALLNQHFVCVLVDRHERRDVADAFATYVHLVKQMEGWPLNVWLTPEFQPFDGSTYLPPTDEWGKEGFPGAARRILAAWQAEPEAMRRLAADAVDALAANIVPVPEPLSPTERNDLLNAASESLRSQFDAATGGFGEQPGYPEPELLRYLLSRDGADRQMALRILRVMADSALRDPLDGGFFRYAADSTWHMPGFQKTLVDQARIAVAYLDAAKLTGDARSGAIARAALEYALTLGDPRKGLAAAEDATRTDLTASFFWTHDEIGRVLGDEAEVFCRAFGVTPEGNLPPDTLPGVGAERRNVLRRVTPFGELEAEQRLARAAARLRTHRSARPRPLRDSIACSGVQGTLLAALARAGAELPEQRFTTTARSLYEYIRDQLCAPEGMPNRRDSVRSGIALPEVGFDLPAGGTRLRAFAGRTLEASPGDYACVAEGLLTYAETTGDEAARHLAKALWKTAMRRFWDPAAGRFFAYADHTEPRLFARVHAPVSGPGEPPSAESAWLLALAVYEVGGDASQGALAAAVAMDLRDGAGRARGDQLLALQVVGSTPR